MNTKTINIDLGGATGPPLQNKKQRKRDGSKIEVPSLNSNVREVTYPEIVSARTLVEDVREPIKKIPKNRVVTETKKWIFGPDELLPEKQMEYINKMKENVDEAQQKERIEVFRLNSVDGSRSSLNQSTASAEKVMCPTSKFIMQQINQKIYGYGSQDLKKGKYVESLIVDSNDVLKLLFECKNRCYYCKESVQVLYQHVREPKQWTLDRIDNSLGHNKTNVLIACLNCNLRRKTMHTERYVFTKQLNIVKHN